MGNWGTGLFSNDCSSDVRDTYLGFLQDQLANQEAYQKTLEKFKEYIGDEEEPLFWYALAATQWKVGRLVSEVKAKALEWIEKDGGIKPWLESKNGGSGWKKTLEKLKTKLESPQPPEKKIRKPDDYIQSPWEVGDVYAFQFQSEESKRLGLFGKFIPFQKIEDEEFSENEKVWKCSRVQIYDKVFENLPVLTDLNGVRILPQALPDEYFYEHEHGQPLSPLEMNAVFLRFTKRSFPEKQFTYIGNQPDRFIYPKVKLWVALALWRDSEKLTMEFYEAWRNENYLITEKGIFLDCSK
jgi:hypothetical protein